MSALLRFALFASHIEKILVLYSRLASKLATVRGKRVKENRPEGRLCDVMHSLLCTYAGLH